jgi:hypothetical protein
MNLLRALPIPRPWSDKLEWPKTRFIEYTDDTFTTKKPQPEWLGILGPVIRAEVGDEVDVTFMNRTRLPHDMHPHGLRYDKNSEGSFYIPFGKGDRIPPGRKFTYRWFATEASGPGPGQPSSIVWWYHAHVDPGIEVNAGLLGPIIVTAKGKANPDGSPKDVDREFVTSFMVFDETAGKRWYLLGMGNEIDLHSPHWHGETVNYQGQHTDVVELLPGSMKTVDMIADNPGTWMFHCHVEDHMENGMMAVFTIAAPPARACPVAFLGGDFWKDPEKAAKRSRVCASCRKCFLPRRTCGVPTIPSGPQPNPFAPARNKLWKSPEHPRRGHRQFWVGSFSRVPSTTKTDPPGARRAKGNVLL